MDAKMALRRIHFGIADRGAREVVDADLSDYSNTIPHGDLLRCVARRIADGTVLATIRQWLDAPVVERVDGGGEIRTNVSRATVFDFLGYTVGRFYGRGGRSYWGTAPSKKAIKKLKGRIHDETDNYTARRLRVWLRRRSGKRGTGYRQYSDQYLYEKLGLIRLMPSVRDRSNAKA